MTQRLIYDIETDGLLAEVSKIHCIVTRDVDTGVVRRYFNPHAGGLCAVADDDRAGSIEDGIRAIARADIRSGHNVDGYDDLVFRKLYPSIAPPVDDARMLDTLVGARVNFPEEHLKALDFVRCAKTGNTFPAKLIGRHSLEAWGHRLGLHKGQKPQDFKVFTRDMLEYCVQDTAVTLALFKRLELRVAAKRCSLRAWRLEQAFAREIRLQEENGFCFDAPAGERLAALLMRRRAELDVDIKAHPTFGDFTVQYTTPVRKQVKTRVVVFNPGSEMHVAKALQERCGWRPADYTGGGRVKLDASILSGIKAFPGVPLLIERDKVSKVLGMLAEGKAAWLKLAGPDGRVHGRVNHNAAVTSRCTHSRPNMSQVPKVLKGRDGAPLLGLAGGYGVECRSLFYAPDALVGGDARGLELRMLAHFLFPYDGGAYARVVTEGDPHAVTRDALGITASPGIDPRDLAKRWFYAWLYGAGDAKLAKVLGCAKLEARRFRLRFLKNLPALAKLKADIARVVMVRGTLRLPDGRHAFVRSPHSALNTLLQGSGAIVMKQAVVLHNTRCRSAGVVAWQVAFSHDEVQIECAGAEAGIVGASIRLAIQDAGVNLGIKCPLDGAFKIGKTWADTH